LAAEAGPMTVDQAARLARLLRLNRHAAPGRCDPASADTGSADAAGRSAA